MKKSLKKQAVFPVLMLLVVTALALIGSSFAWFSMANTASVSRIDGTIEKSSVGLMISQDAENFTSSITLGSSAATFVNPKYFHQVSSKDGVNFYEATITAKNPNGTASMIKTSTSSVDPISNGTGQLAGWYKVGAGAATALTSGAQDIEVSSVTYNNQAGYMVFDLFFQVEYESDLYLDSTTDFNANAGNKAGVTNNAMRIAFIDKGCDSTGNTATSKQLNASEKTTIWDPAGQGSYYAVKAASGETEFEPYAANATYTVSTSTKSTAELVPDNALSDETVFGSGEGKVNISSIASLGAGVNKLRVVVWLEGNDASCTSSIAELAIQLTLSFYARKTA